MKRKLIKQANQAYTLTLPISWVRKNNLDKPGSEIDLDEQERSLVLTNKGLTQTRKVSIDLSNKKGSRGVGSAISALYAIGIDEINIRAKEDISILLIESLNENIGYALISKEKESYIVRDVGGSAYSNLEEIFKRVFQMLIIFYESAVDDIFGREIETMEGLHKRDREINKFCLLLERAVNKMSCTDIIQSRIIFAYAIELERIGDEIHRLWRTNIQNNIKKTPAIRKIFDYALEALEKSFDFYFGLDNEAQEKIVVIKKKAREDLLRIGKQDAVVSQLLSYILKIVEDASDLIHLTLMKKG
jgi:phosphate uptake regulator